MFKVCFCFHDHKLPDGGGVFAAVFFGAIAKSHLNRTSCYLLDLFISISINHNGSFDNFSAFVVVSHFEKTVVCVPPMFAESSFPQTEHTQKSVSKPN